MHTHITCSCSSEPQYKNVLMMWQNMFVSLTVSQASSESVQVCVACICCEHVIPPSLYRMQVHLAIFFLSDNTLTSSSAQYFMLEIHQKKFETCNWCARFNVNSPNHLVTSSMLQIGKLTAQRWAEITECCLVYTLSNDH